MSSVARQVALDGPEIFPADEAAVLAEFFSLTGRQGRGQRGVAALPDLIEDHAELAEKVAAIALAAIQEYLPNFTSVSPDGDLLSDRKLKASRARRVMAMPRHLFTIDWAMSAPGLSWPEAYHATFIPGFDRYVVTASRDSDDTYGCCDLAIGWFDAHTDWKESSKAIVRAWWAKQRDCDQESWVDLLDAGSLGRANAHALRAAIWPEKEESDEEGQ